MFIAVSWRLASRDRIEILDAVTLARLSTLEFPLGELDLTWEIVFSSDVRLLTWTGASPESFVTWDLQTGVLASVISPTYKRDHHGYLSVAYSVCGTMLGVLVECNRSLVISTYNVLSGTHIHSYPVNGKALHMRTQGDRLQFTTVESTSITMWEVGFTSMHAPTEVWTLPMPDDCQYDSQYSRQLGCPFHPTPPRIASATGKQVLIWDLRDSKSLLDTQSTSQRIAFSLDGRLFATGRDWDPKIHLWKESPTGYILHREFSPDTEAFRPLISPNGESIIAFGTSAIQLWHTTDSTASLPAISTGEERRDDFVLALSPDKVLAAVARMGEKTVAVLDLRSGTPRLIIDTEMKVCALGVAGSTVVVVGDERIITWNLPGEDAARNTRANVNDSARITAFNHQSYVSSASISPDLQCVVTVESGLDIQDSCLDLYDVSTGKRLGSVYTHFNVNNPWFTPDGSEVWCDAENGEAVGWKIIEDSESDVVDSESDATDSESDDVSNCESDVVKLEQIWGAWPPNEFPWQPSLDYELTDDGWILDSDEKRLFWLPAHWRSKYGEGRMWCGRFLALLHSELPEAVILEFE